MVKIFFFLIMWTLLQSGAHPTPSALYSVHISHLDLINNKSYSEDDIVFVLYCLCREIVKGAPQRHSCPFHIPCQIIALLNIFLKQWSLQACTHGRKPHLTDSGVYFCVNIQYMGLHCLSHIFGQLWVQSTHVLPIGLQPMCNNFSFARNGREKLINPGSNWRILFQMISTTNVHYEGKSIPEESEVNWGNRRANVLRHHIEMAQQPTPSTFFFFFWTFTFEGREGHPWPPHCRAKVSMHALSHTHTPK